ncbi:MAG TPA: hypothetical protein VEK57_02645 [Thermoanaerobaculia bacterium]|nr:hypothetical protein [Thermoanaerobaculia bacterium]
MTGPAWLTPTRLRSLLFMAPVFLGAVSFSLVIACSRFFFGNVNLTHILDLQSSTAFFTFLIQAGLRAGMRKEYLVGNERVVRLIEQYFLRKWPYYSVPASLLVVLVFGGTFLPILCTLNAVYSLMLGLRLVQVRVPAAAYHSVNLFIVNTTAGALYLFFPDAPKLYLDLAAEAFALTWGIVSLAGTVRGRLSPKRAAKTFVLVLRRYAGLQVSSFLIVLHGYAFAQTIVLAGGKDLQLAVYYSDAVMATGLIIMVLSRVSLVFEKQMVAKGLIRRYILILHLAFAAAAVLFAAATRRNVEAIVLVALFFLSLLGRYTTGVISGFLDESHRARAILWIGAFASVPLIGYAMVYAYDWDKQVIAATAACSLFLLSSLFVTFFKAEGAYIGDAEADGAR